MQSYAPPAVRPNHWRRMTGLSNNFLIPPLRLISSFQPLMCSSNHGWQIDWMRECVCMCVHSGWCVCMCVWVCQIALAFLWLIRCPCAELGNSADSSQLAWRGQNKSHRDARRMTTHRATHRRAAKIPPTAQHTHSLYACFPFCCLEFPYFPSSSLFFLGNSTAVPSLLLHTSSPFS